MRKSTHCPTEQNLRDMWDLAKIEHLCQDSRAPEGKEKESGTEKSS